MKKLVKQPIECATFPERGSAPESNVRRGIIPFGRGNSSHYNFRDGWQMAFATANATYNTNTGNIGVYLNIYVQKLNTRWSDGLSTEFFAYTPEEAERLIDALTNMSEEELVATIKAITKR